MYQPTNLPGTNLPVKCDQRIAVVGTTGSGKTTLARRISQCLSISHVELDALHWGPNWTPIPLELFRDRTAQALSGDTWVVDGNYSKVRDIIWSRADTIVWLDYALLVILTRLMWRTLRRIFTQEELWGGNRESFLAQFSTRDSILLWAFRTYPCRRREYPLLFKKPEHDHLAVVRLHSPRATLEWLEGLR
ncbi:MAG: adenylate kinase [Chloroflexota bacterium]|nr:adenylate kinase [Chloroflexota bacterium]